MQVSVVSDQGKEAVVAILGTKDFFGEGCIAGQARRMATVWIVMMVAMMLPGATPPTPFVRICR